MANANIQTVTSWADRFKFTLALAAVVGGLVGFYLLSDYPTVVRFLVVLAGLVVGAGIGWTSEPGRRFFGFAKDSWAEARRVVWPSRKETLQTTGVVFAFVFVMAIFLWATDKSLELVLYDWILGWRH